MLTWIRLRRIRFREQKNLDRSNLKLYKKIVSYMENSPLGYLEKEEALHQVLDMMLESQVEHTAFDVMMGDYELFCKSIVEEYSKDKSKLYQVLHYLQRSVVAMLFMVVVFLLVSAILTPEEKEIDAYFLVLSFGYAFILMPFANRKMVFIIGSVFVYIFVMYLSLIKMTESINMTVIGNTGIVLLSLAMIALVIEIYKKIYNIQKR